MSAPQLVTVTEIAARLREQARDVAHRYCSSAGAYAERGQHHCLNPGRADRSVGSFIVTLAGPYAGRWRDFATGQQGDMLDLIQLALGCDRVAAIKEAKSFLGIEDARPGTAALIAARRAEMERAAAARRESEAEAAGRRRAAAQRLWLGATDQLAGTPTAAYLEARGLGLGGLPYTPHAIRHARSLRYRHTDRQTGEIWEGEAPAMVTAVTGADGAICAVHRVWLEQGADGRWRKLSIPAPKKVLGAYWGGTARIWRGLGPRGGRGARLGQVAPGAKLVLCEGIEDALAIARLRPDLRVLAAISLGNMAAAALPPAVAEVVLAADNDTHPDALRAFDAAVAAHRAAGRVVRVHRSPVGKDFADLAAELEAAS